MVKRETVPKDINILLIRVLIIGVLRVVSVFSNNQ